MDLLLDFKIRCSKFDPWNVLRNNCPEIPATS